MRILLAHNSPYFPAFGGGDKSNRLLMESLAARGHSVQVAARADRFEAAAHERLLAGLAGRGIPAAADAAGVRFPCNGVAVHVLTLQPHVRAWIASEIAAFDPDAILTSTDDPAHLMLEPALAAARSRVVYLVRATVALPFGPDTSFASARKTAILRQADGVVAVSEYVADYARRWGGLDAVHVPISLLEPGEFPSVGRFDNRFVTMVNPCAVKGISIFLALARCFPETEFAAVPTWGTTPADLAALRAQPNISVLPPADRIDEILQRTRIVLVPSLWAEARSRMILEAMARGIPVMASQAGGLAEAMLGMDYLLPVRPVVHYRSTVDELMVPAADIPEQDIGPWRSVLARLLTDRAHYERLSAASRSAALAYAATLTCLPFESYLKRIVQSPKRQAAGDAAPNPPLSPERRKLMALRLRRKLAESHDAPRATDVSGEAPQEAVGNAPARAGELTDAAHLPNVSGNVAPEPLARVPTTAGCRHDALAGASTPAGELRDAHVPPNVSGDAAREPLARVPTVGAYAADRAPNASVGGRDALGSVRPLAGELRDADRAPNVSGNLAPEPLARVPAVGAYAADRAPNACVGGRDALPSILALADETHGASHAPNVSGDAAREAPARLPTVGAYAADRAPNACVGGRDALGSVRSLADETHGADRAPNVSGNLAPEPLARVPTVGAYAADRAPNASVGGRDALPSILALADETHGASHAPNVSGDAAPEALARVPTVGPNAADRAPNACVGGRDAFPSILALADETHGASHAPNVSGDAAPEAPARVPTAGAQGADRAPNACVGGRDALGSVRPLADETHGASHAPNVSGDAAPEAFARVPTVGPNAADRAPNACVGGRDAFPSILALADETHGASHAPNVSGDAAPEALARVPNAAAGAAGALASSTNPGSATDVAD